MLVLDPNLRPCSLMTTCAYFSSSYMLVPQVLVLHCSACLVPGDHVRFWNFASHPVRICIFVLLLAIVHSNSCKVIAGSASFANMWICTCFSL